MRAYLRPIAGAPATAAPHAPVFARAATGPVSRPSLSLSTAAAATAAASIGQRQRHRRHRRLRNLNFVAVRAAAVASDASAKLIAWLVEERGMEAPSAEPGKDGGLVARRAIRKGEPIVVVPGDLAVTAVDAAEHPVVGGIVTASGVGDVVALALWLLAERAAAAAAVVAPAAESNANDGDKTKSKGKDWSPLVAVLPPTTDSPVLWPDDVRAELLKGSPVLAEARERDAALDEQWRRLDAAAREASGGSWPGEASSSSSSNANSFFTREAFRDAVAVVLSHATYLPAAGCFALLPLVSLAGRTGRVAGGAAGAASTTVGDGSSESSSNNSSSASSSSPTARSNNGKKTGAILDYDESLGAAVLTATADYSPGELVLLADGRSSGELLLATGRLYADDDPLALARTNNASTFTDNPSECLSVTVGLVPTDRLLQAKRSILEAAGFPPGSDVSQPFPIHADRMPLQLLAYLRLARLQDSAQLASVAFDRDVVISQLNEYEVLQLLLGECKERLGAYGAAAEDDLKVLQRPLEGSESESESKVRNRNRERLAARLRLAEKSVLQGTLDAVRRRLAPIRGVPTKEGGMTDANADLLEIFGAIEALPSAPGKMLGGLLSWARGDNDPEFQKNRNRRK